MFMLLTCCSTVQFFKFMSPVVCVICMCVIVIYFNKNSNFEHNLSNRVFFILVVKSHTVPELPITLYYKAKRCHVNYIVSFFWSVI